MRPVVLAHGPAIALFFWVVFGAAASAQPVNEQKLAENLGWYDAVSRVGIEKCDNLSLDAKNQREYSRARKYVLSKRKLRKTYESSLAEQIQTQHELFAKYGPDVLCQIHLKNYGPNGDRAIFPHLFVAKH